MAKLTTTQIVELFEVLKKRFGKNAQRHLDLDWSQVKASLDKNPAALTALNEMERTGGEPDVVSFAFAPGEIIFCDCAIESPTERRSLCYDQAALDGRKENKPKGSVLETAKLMGVELLTELEYRALQDCGEFDKKTSSWVQTPAAIRKLGGALFCDRRYGQVFTYHNGAESYYAARGFRGLLRV
jgi:Protein of unknown function (DUF4256)